MAVSARKKIIEKLTGDFLTNRTKRARLMENVAELDSKSRVISVNLDAIDQTKELHKALAKKQEWSEWMKNH